MTRRSRIASSNNREGVSPAMKWVIGAVIGGIASAATGFWLDRVINKPRNAPAETAQNAAPVSWDQPPARQPITIPPNLLDQLRPPAPQQPSPAPQLPTAVPAPPNPNISRPTPPTIEAVSPFVKPATPPPASDFKGLVAYWSLDEGKGTDALDSAGKTKGAVNGSKWVPGIRGQAVELNGSGFVGLGASPKLNFPAQSAFTLACWVKPASNSGKVFWLRSHPDGLAIIGVQIADGKLRGWVRHDGGIFHPSSFGGEVAGTTALRVGEWHHIALVRHANGQPEMFQDGQSVGRAAGGRETPGKVTTNVRALGLDPHALLQNANHSEVQALQGCVDEFCAFNRALSADEIAKLAGREP
jgi:hypothetical protein